MQAMGLPEAKASDDRALDGLWEDDLAVVWLAIHATTLTNIWRMHSEAEIPECPGIRRAMAEIDMILTHGSLRLGSA